MTKNHLGILIIILLCATGLRFYGLDWGTDHQTGQFHAFHPDEQTLIDSAQHIGQNMRDIVASYGKAPMYLLSATAHTIGFLFQTPPFAEHTTRFTHLIARSLSALLGIGTVFLVFLIGRKMGSPFTGLLSALFLALCAGHIQQSHYYTVDVSLTFWVTLSLYIALYLPTSQTRLYVAFGLVIGLATGTRLVGVWMGIPFLLVHLLSPNTHTFQTRNLSHLKSLTTWKQIGMATAVGIVVLFICEPFLILDPTLFFSDSDPRRLIPSMEVAQGERIRIWTLYDFSTTPYLFYITHLLRDALGYPLEIAAGIGIILAIYQRSFVGLVLLSWLIPYFLLVGSLHTKPIRYVTPMLPAFCIFGAHASVVLGHKLHHSKKWIIALPCLLVALPTFMYACAIASIFGKEDSRIVATRWMAQNIPHQASVLTERGGFPTQWMMPQDLYRIKTDQASYLLNTEGFIPYYAQIAYFDDMLKTVDWIITIDENRARQFEGAPAQYPIGHTFYKKLKQGEVGFTLFKQFQNKPTFLGWSFHNTHSDPTVTAYDHPRVIIYKRTGNVTAILKSWQEQVKTDPTFPDQAFLAGIEAYKNQNWAQAQNAFQKAIDIRPNYLLSQILQMHIFLKTKQNQKADALWQQIENEYGGIPNEIAMGLSKAGLYSESILYLERSMAFYLDNGNMPPWIPKALAENWYRIGQTLQEQQRYEEAQNAYKQVMALLPEFDSVYQNLGEIALIQNQPAQALSQFQKAMTHDLRNAHTWYLMGRAYHMQGDIQNAQIHYQQAIGLAPQEPTYQNALQTLSNP